MAKNKRVLEGKVGREEKAGQERALAELRRLREVSVQRQDGTARTWAARNVQCDTRVVTFVTEDAGKEPVEHLYVLAPGDLLRTQALEELVEPRVEVVHGRLRGERVQ